MQSVDADAAVAFGSLAFRHQLLLWAARHWVTASARGDVMPGFVKAAFCVAHAPAAMDYLNAVMTIIGVTAERTVVFHPVGHPMLSLDEMCFLTALEAAGREDGDSRAFDVLSQWLPPAAVRQALQSARRLSQSLRAGLKCAARTTSADGPAHATGDPLKAVLWSGSLH